MLCVIIGELILLVQEEFMSMRMNIIFLPILPVSPTVFHTNVPKTRTQFEKTGAIGTNRTIVKMV